MTQCWWMNFPLCPWGWRQGVPPAIVLHIAGTWKGNPPFLIVALTMAVAIVIAVAISVVVADSIAIAVAVAHCCCHCPLPLLSTIVAAVSVALPSAITAAIAIAPAVGHSRLHHCRPSQLPSPSAITIAMLLVISESCCLVAARIVFNQLKQRMLTLFYFVWTVGGTLIEARWLTRCRVAMAITSVGRQVASSERIVREVAGSRGAAEGQQGGHVGWPWEVLFCCIVGVSAVDRWHLWWCVGCGRRHCRWDSDWTDARRTRDWRNTWFRKENVYMRKNQKDVTHWVIRCAEKHCRWDNNENDARGSRDSQKICSSQRNVYWRRNEDMMLWTLRFET